MKSTHYLLFGALLAMGTCLGAFFFVQSNARSVPEKGSVVPTTTDSGATVKKAPVQAVQPPLAGNTPHREAAASGTPDASLKSVSIPPAAATSKTAPVSSSHPGSVVLRHSSASATVPGISSPTATGFTGGDGSQIVSVSPATASNSSPPTTGSPDVGGLPTVYVPQDNPVPAVLAEPGSSSALDPVSQKEVDALANNFLDSVDRQIAEGTPPAEAWKNQQNASDDAFRARYGWEAFNTESLRANLQARGNSAP